MHLFTHRFNKYLWKVHYLSVIALGIQNTSVDKTEDPCPFEVYILEERGRTYINNIINTIWESNKYYGGKMSRSAQRSLRGPVLDRLVAGCNFKNSNMVRLHWEGDTWAQTYRWSYPCSSLGQEYFNNRNSQYKIPEMLWSSNVKKPKTVAGEVSRWEGEGVEVREGLGNLIKLALAGFGIVSMCSGAPWPNLRQINLSWHILKGSLWLLGWEWTTWSQEKT